MILDTVVIGLLSSLFVLVAVQTVYAYSYCRILHSSYLDYLVEPVNAPNKIDARIARKTAIVLCLRGVDPSLVGCLDGILRQQPAGWQLHIVFDNHDDPAVNFVNQFFSERAESSADQSAVQPHLHFNTDRPDTCSLKCSSIVTVLRQLPEEMEYVALIDADTVADHRWLSDLLSPFADPQVGATTGNRWFTAQPPGGADEVRKVWNAAAVVQVLLYNIAWGGTLAFRRSAIDHCGLLGRWQHAFCEDTMVADALAAQDLKLHRVPHLIMNNTESTDLRSCFGWIVRQMLTVRIHHKLWPLVLLHGLFTGLIVYATPLLAIGCVLCGYWQPAIWLAIAFLIYQMLNMLLLAFICDRNQRIVQAREAAAGPIVAGDKQRHPSRSINSWFALCTATVVNQLLYPIAIIKTWLTRTTRWRGIDYSVLKDGEIVMREYVPYRQIADGTDMSASIQ